MNWISEIFGAPKGKVPENRKTKTKEKPQNSLGEERLANRTYFKKYDFQNEFIFSDYSEMGNLEKEKRDELVEILNIVNTYVFPNHDFLKALTDFVHYLKKDFNLQQTNISKQVFSHILQNPEIKKTRNINILLQMYEETLKEQIPTILMSLAQQIAVLETKMNSYSENNRERESLGWQVFILKNIILRVEKYETNYNLPKILELVNLADESGDLRLQNPESFKMV